jgi:hypothetical protein
VVLIKNPYGGAGSPVDPSFNSSIAGVAFNFGGADKNTPPHDNLVVLSYSTSVPTWSTGTGTGAMILPTTRFAVGGNQVLTGVGTFVLGTFDVGWTGPDDNTTKPFTARIPQEVIGLADGGGQRVAWNSVKSVFGNDNYSYKYVSFDAGLYGNPGWGTKAGANAQLVPNPLYITKTPEPSSLALIVLGGFALLRRR